MERLIRLSEEQWEKIAPLLPPPSVKGGRPPKPHRTMVEAMVWILRTGAPWRDLPSAYGPWESVYNALVAMVGHLGVLARLFEALARERDSEGATSSMPTIVRAHQDASGAAKKGGPRDQALARRSVHEDPTPSSTRSAIRSSSRCRPGRRTK
jgi:transposase